MLFRLLLPFIISLCHVSMSLATTFTWTGGTDIWENHNRWSPQGVPGEGDVVIIPSGHVIIQDGKSFEIGDVTISAKGQLEIQQGGELIISGAFDRAALINHGLLSIDGLLKIPKGDGSPSDVHGLENYGSTNVGSEADVILFDLPGWGIDNKDGGQFNNSGNIDISVCGGGISNREDFVTDGNISIEDVTHPVFKGIENRQTFTNNLPGVIFLFNANFAINCMEGSVFHNHHKVIVQTSSIGWSNFGTVYNYTTGHIALTSNSAGFTVAAQGSLYNYGVMAATMTNGTGLSIHNYAENHGMILMSNNAQGMGIAKIWQTVDPVMVNFNYISLSNNSNLDLNISESQLTNFDHGFIEVSDDIDAENITNYGIFCVQGTGPHNVDFNNYGVLQDLHGTLNGQVNNGGVILRPIPGPLVNGSPVVNATDKASFPYNVNIGTWFNQFYGSTIAGNYNYGSNVFTPNANGAGRPYVYVEASIISSGLTDRLKVLVEPSGGSIIAETYKMDKPSDSHMSKSECYPNPNNGAFSLPFGEGIKKIEIINQNGQVVFQSSCPQRYLDLRQTLTSGIYVVKIFRAEGDPVLSKISVHQ